MCRPCFQFPLISNINFPHHPPDPATRLQELSFSTHISLLAMIVPLKSRKCANLSRVVNDYTFLGPNQVVAMVKQALNG
jgi:hypothetical protein